MTPALFAGLFFHFMLLSLIAIGGFMVRSPACTPTLWIRQDC